MPLEPCEHQGIRVLPELLARELGFQANVRGGRFTGEFNIVLEGEGLRVATLKVFCGRGPYRGWIEIFDVDPVAYLRIEDRLYEIIANTLKPGEPLYIDYSWDQETLKLLDQGAPPTVTRIGFKLLERGFTWFKVWYYPEGFMEGNVKIQAEKAVGQDAMVRHLRDICIDLKSFIGAWSGASQVPEAIMGALEKARILWEDLECGGRGVG